ncbi:uncharacterized protein DS421_20g697910 [Arachis hypogaea]|nr:uncharacterized protein DS421_20g697910 [Arachis hypogaea]
METWAMVEKLLSAMGLVAAQQAAQRNESFTLKLVWLRDRVCQMPPTDDPKTLRQYDRCYIMLLIGGYLMTDKSNNLSLCSAAQQGVTDIAGCTPLLMSWIYQRFSQWCPPDRWIYQYPLAARLVGLQQQSRDQHEARVLRWRVSINQLRFDESLR